MTDGSFEHIESDVYRKMLREVRERYEALSGRYLTMPLGQLHIDIGTLLSIIDNLERADDSTKWLEYKRVLNDIAQQVIAGVITWEEAEKKCYDLGKGWMNIIDVEAELRQIVRDDALEKAPVWVKWQADVINKLMEHAENLQADVARLTRVDEKQGGMFDENEGANWKP